MSQNYYSEIHLHFVWHTKESLPLLTPKVEPLAHRALRKKIVACANAFVHEIGGTATHVHVAVTLSPTILISEFVGQLKGASPHDVNQQFGQKVLQWQSGYGVVSFGSKDLKWVVGYIQGQKEHHATGNVVERLERINSEGDL